MMALWIIGIVIVLSAGIVALLISRYNQFRKLMPQPPYKQAAQRPNPRTWRDDEVTVSWIGHSTLLINLFGTKIITDPVFAEKVGISLGVTKIGSKRHTAPALPVEEVGEIDLILLSHAHMDHVDMQTLRQLANQVNRRNVTVITAVGTSRLFKRLQFGRVLELGGTDSVTTADGVTITAVPVRHWGARFPWNKEYKWTGYVMEKRGTRLFFAGDTAYTPTFTELQKMGGIQVAFLPIGAYSPDHFQGSHCTPEQAWEMFKDSGADWLVPIHWDTFVLSYEPVDEPLERLLAAAGDEVERVVMREHGVTFKIDGVVAMQKG